MVFAKRQIVHPAAGKFVGLIETRKTTFGGHVKGILYHHRAAQSDGRRIVDRLRKYIAASESDPVRHAFAHPYRRRMKDGISRGRFIDKGLRAGGVDGSLDVQARALRSVVAYVQ